MNRRPVGGEGVGSTGCFSRRAAESAFTLVEMVVVIAIVSLLALMVLPKLTGGDEGLRTSARSLAALVRYLGERGATTGGTYRLHLNLADNSVTVGLRSATGGETLPADTFFRRRFLAEGVNIADVNLPRTGRVTDGEATVDVGPGGLGEFLIIHLKGRGDTYFTLFAYPNGGRVKVAKGYEETGR